MTAQLAVSAWWDLAACAQTDPELWFPEKGATNPDAARICATCPVKQQCLEDALASGDPHGVRGGLSPNQRARLPQSQPRACRHCDQPLPVGVHATTRLHPECIRPWKNVRRRRAERRNP